MINLDKYKKNGNFLLHSGYRSNVFYDVQAMITDKGNMNWIVEQIPKDCDTYLGIATAGAIIASHMSRYAIFNKEKEVKGNIFGKICVVDDVCTTESSLRDVIKWLHDSDFYNIELFVVVDRREIRSLDIKYIFMV